MTVLRRRSRRLAAGAVVAAIATTATIASGSSANGTSQPVAAWPVKGTVLVKDPHATSFVPLAAAAALPVGTTVDVVRGWIRLGRGVTSAQFYRGEFTLGRRPGGVTTLTLTGGTRCPAGAGTASTRATGSPKKPLFARKLWGTGHGNFTTVGNFASASVVGTHWLTWDTCSGTEIRVATGEVRVTNLVTHASFLLRAPHSYLARR